MRRATSRPRRRAGGAAPGRPTPASGARRRDRVPGGRRPEAGHASRLQAAVAIRPAAATELPALAELMAASALLRRYGTTATAARAALARAAGAGDLLLVASDRDGRPIGIAWVIRSRAFTGAAYLRLLLVAEGHASRGMGAALLAAAEAESRAWANHLALLVTTDNAGARRFYARHGYRHVGNLPALADPALDEALYWKTLRRHGERLPM